MKKIFLVLIIVLVALATLAGGWLIYKKGDFSFAQSAGQGGKINWAILQGH